MSWYILFKSEDFKIKTIVLAIMSTESHHLNINTVHYLEKFWYLCYSSRLRLCSENAPAPLQSTQTDNLTIEAGILWEAKLKVQLA